MYNDLNNIVREIPWDTLLQLVIDEPVDVTREMVTAAWDPEGDLSSFTDEEAAAATDAAAAIRDALVRASGLVDGYCGKRNQVPFDPVPDFVKALDLDIAVYNLFSRRNNIPENKTDRYKNAVKNLEGLSKGTITLGLQDPAPATTHSSATPQVMPGSRQFSRDRLKGF